MALDIVKLNKILQFEAADGYLDRKVMGGLAGFIGNWTNAALRGGLTPAEAQLVEQVADRLTDYAALSPLARRKAIQDVIERATQIQTALNVNTPERLRAGVRGQVIGDRASDNLTPNTQHLTPNPTPIQNSKLKTQNYDPIKPLPPEKLDLPLDTIKGVGEATARLISLMGLQTINDALYYFPFRHEDYSSFKKINELLYGKVESVLVQINEVKGERTFKGGKEIVTVKVSDDTGFLKAIFFNRRQAAYYKPGMKVVMSGRVEEWGGQLCLKSPTVENAEKELLNTGRLVPVYHLIGPIKLPTLRRVIKNVVDNYVGALPEHMPADIKKRNHLLDLAPAVRNLHYPLNFTDRERARRRLAFDEFFLIQLGVLMKRREWQDELPGVPLHFDPSEWYKTLPFPLTGDQKKAINDILADMSKNRPMRRLVQGDVGSGKTVVGATALLAAVRHGYQGVMMAPTQILAEQHYKGLKALFGQERVTLSAEQLANPTTLFNEIDKETGTRPLKVVLLSGSVKKKDKEQVYEQIAAGEADVIIGTTAIIQEGVQFNKLGIVITDEQHRFGVIQRSTLRDKGNTTNPHVLTMTATPIPRSLSLTIYGDLDVSIIREKPPGRMEIKTKWLMPLERDRGYNFIRKQIGLGRQAFIICPLVEESDKIEAKAAIDEHARLQAEVYPDLKLGLLHGRMKPAEKDAIMLDFREKKFDILVATSVIEVGIDIPNASVILIEGADRFGLSQLHQFRGRVGRGQHASYCLLLAGEELSEEGQKRLKIIEDTNDGFVLAEEDLKLRGPGEFFGTRQSGVPDLRVAGVNDTDLLELARAEASKLFERDPELSDNPQLAKKVSQLWSVEGDLS